jgi:leucyl/phenylalanyl-tRNA--protein transferase
MPRPESAPSHGCLAAGGDLEPGTILAAYRSGIFPWPDPDGRLLWWSPDPRAVLPLDGFHESRSLQRLRRRGIYRVSRDEACGAVIAGCADRVEGTWITPAMRRAYEYLHALGWVHSVEVWDGADLVGGVYGVAIGGLFAAESKFHRVRDASKIALAELVAWLAEERFHLLDVQLATDHLRTLGVVEISREAYLARLRVALAGDRSL